MDDKGSCLNVDGPSILKKELHVPARNLSKEISGRLCKQLELLTSDTFPFLIFKLRTSSDDPLP
jgi:hypothetical protein